MSTASSQKPKKSQTTRDQPGPSFSAQGSSRKRAQAYNTANIVLDAVGNVAEASEVLAPLKAACKATKSILDVLFEIDDNREEWKDLTRRLEEYKSAVENQIDSFEKYPLEEITAVDEAFSRPLVRYVELLEDFQSTVQNKARKRRPKGLAALTEIRKVKIDAGVIREFNQDLEDRHRQFMEALSLFTALRVQIIEQSTKATERNTKTTRSKVETILTDDSEGETGPPDTPPVTGGGTGPLAGLGPEGHNTILGLVQQRPQGLLVQSSGYVESLPITTKKRVLALKGVQSDYEKLFLQYKKETLDLEKKYSTLYNPLFTRRLEIIKGASLPTKEELQKGHDQEVKDKEDLSDDEPEDEEDKDEESSFLPSDPILDGEDGAKDGIPQFWLATLRNHAGLSDLISERDEQALTHLTDIKLEHLGTNDASNKMGFKLIFEFSPNAFFEETVLTKTYFYSDELSYEGDFVFDRAVGTPITWKADQDLTKEVEIKKQRSKHTNKTRLVKKARTVPSFFDFFSPPVPPTEEQLENMKLEEDELEKLEANLELDYQIGEDLKDKVVPRAIDYFTGKALRYEMDDEDSSEGDYDEGDDDEEDDDEEDGDGDGDKDGAPKRKANAAAPKGAKKASGDQECKQQ